MKIWFCLAFFLVLSNVNAQRKIPDKSKEQKKIEKQAKKQERKEKQPPTELRWDTRKLPIRSKGYPEISAWHTGTTGIIPSDAAEVSLFNPTRIGLSKKTEGLVRIAEFPLLPNIGLKHLWWRGNRFSLTSEHTLYYTYPGLKILQKTGFKDLIPDTVKINQGVAMRHEFLFSWLMNPQTWGCPDLPPEKILTLRLGAEFYIGNKNTEIQSFDYAHLLYHTQLLDNKVLYYGGLQFDSYFGHRFHYSLNGLYYSVNMKKEYAIEANLRLTCYISKHWGISLAGKGAYLNLKDKTKFACLPFLDLTYIVNPGRTTIKHGLFKNKRRHK